MGDPTDDSYILIEDSRNLDEALGEQGNDVHDKSENASQYTLDQQGIFIEPLTNDIETSEPIEGLSERLFNEGGIEIIPNKGAEDDFNL
ncbi:MAG: hypothetical protein A2481_03895 [Candidatus Yonathbacteria bacterium RIFOXYC2_FULL_47_9]|nr:MAG: hypothetical protein A2481_03895 [Candidatus Yonathbacteria bacterium RIFOXYC2_FULL_47_9]HAT68231.1 hypothetical protein [Candidatus Yonathbacteria bacterium]